MRKLFLAMALSCSAAIALAQVTVSAPWVRATVPTAKVTGAFMQLRSAGDARLVEARSSLAGMVEMHRMEMDGQTMRMHAVDGIDLAAGKTVNLASGGYHIMLMDLKRQLKEGEMVPLTLIVEQKNKLRETLELSVPVKPLTYVARAAPH